MTNQGIKQQGPITYKIKWTLKGESFVVAESPREAREQFEKGWGGTSLPFWMHRDWHRKIISVNEP